MARKPFKGTVAANVLLHGTGALNIDASRVAYEDTPNPATNPLYRAQHGYAGTGNDAGSSSFKLKAAGAEADANLLGRWPANIMHDGSDEVRALFPAQAGASAPVRGTEPSSMTKSVFGQINRQSSNAFHGDTGSAARFFYCAKASPKDRHAGFEKPAPVSKHGTTLRTMENLEPGRPGNHHPTVKPTSLMQHLCKLVTPPGGVVLDLFMGSGSTGRAARLEGFRFIGFELQAEYVEIARVRIADAEPKAVAQPELNFA